ncbi:MAG TPA: hypothetical protein VGS79_00965 [Puia sp.]|nr:hypothetical protein [Puia sp.]
MRNLTLYHAMTASAPHVYEDLGTSTDPDSTSCIFLEKGHMIEYVQAGARKIVSLFFGPEEYVIPCHPFYSTLKRLDPVTTITFTHRNIFRTLRQYPESSAQYQGVRLQYQEKVNERLMMQQAMTARERYDHLLEKQPWVFSLVGRSDIASYLGVTVDELRELAK